MTDEVISARPVPPPDPESTAAPIEAALPVQPEEPAPMEAKPASAAPEGSASIYRVLQEVETALGYLHGTSEVQQGTANPERVASALTLVSQARQRFEEWLSQF